jgi:uncharacterized protein (DUF1330 family)
VPCIILGKDVARGFGIKGWRIPGMSAYLIVKLKFRDLGWSKAYLASVPAILRRHGGAYLDRGTKIERYEGDAPTPDHVTILTFPSLDAIRAFMNSSDYAPFRDARIAGAASDILAFET